MTNKQKIVILVTNFDPVIAPYSGRAPVTVVIPCLVLSYVNGFFIYKILHLHLHCY